MTATQGEPELLTVGRMIEVLSGLDPDMQLSIPHNCMCCGSSDDITSAEVEIFVHSRRADGRVILGTERRRDELPGRITLNVARGSE